MFKHRIKEEEKNKPQLSSDDNAQNKAVTILYSYLCLKVVASPYVNSA